MGLWAVGVCNAWRRKVGAVCGDGDQAGAICRHGRPVRSPFVDEEHGELDAPGDSACCTHDWALSGIAHPFVDEEHDDQE